MGTLSNFISTINTYGVRASNTFAMKISIPNATMKAMSNYDSSTKVPWKRLENELNNNLFCFGHGFTIPNRTITYAPVAYQGVPIDVPTSIRFGNEHQMTFNDDMSGSLRTIFMLWQNATINGNVEDGNFEGNRFTGNPLETFTANLKVYLLSNEYDENTVNNTAFGEKNMGYELKGVTVASIGETALSNTEPGIATLPITLKSQYWKPFIFDPVEVEGLAGRKRLSGILNLGN